MNRIKYDLFIRVRCKIRTFISTISIVLLLVICFEVHAQNPQITVSKFAFSLLNKKDNSFIVIDDSAYYWSIKVSDKVWKKNNYVFKSNELSFGDFLSYYRPVSLNNGRILFCHHGVGTVYELRNDTILRIDRSFNHRNQYNSAIFGYENNLYAFGGYGLFLTKNLFVSYSNELNEWRQVVSNKGIQPRTSPKHIVTRDALYVFGGFNKIDADVYHEYDDCWKYQFSSRKWKKLGQVIIQYDNHAESEDNFQSQLLFQEPYILRVNIEDNIVKRYTDRDIIQESVGQFDTSQNNILLSEVVNNLKVISLNKTTDILHTYVDEIPFYTPKSSYTNYLLIVVFFVMGGAFLVYRTRKRTKKVKQHKNIQKIINKNGFLYIHDRPVEDYFDGFALTLLQKFLNAPEEYISLNELDELCNPDRKASYVSAKKRREQSLRIIKEKLAITLDINPKEVFIEIRDGEDKRIKKMKLNTLELLSDNISNNSI